MIHAYNEFYLNSVIHNDAAVSDMGINAELQDADEFAGLFAKSNVASGIEAASPDMLVGKSATELLSLIMKRDLEYTNVPINRTPEYWAGWVLAYAQWYMNKRFEELLSVIPFSRLVSLYHPYHEADEMKVVDKITELFPKETALKRMRQKRKLSQGQLAQLSGVKLRSIQAYEQGDNDIGKAQGETLYLLAKALDCSIEELLKEV